MADKPNPLRGVFGVGELERRLQDLKAGKPMAQEERYSDLRSQIQVVRDADNAGSLDPIDAGLIA